ncbi:MAG: nucleotidyltransferase [Candidatus Omnitrophica bacterium]|nr:nucleotidyltransferase [Candidatus Omnitrophota bacterium]
MANDYKSAFHLISDISKKTGISCILIGGFAVNYYKFTRQTADIDFLITRNDFEKISGLLEKVGYKKDFSQDVFVGLKSNKLYLMDIDFMFVDRETLDKIIKDGKGIDIAKHKFIIPSLNNLIALKLHSLKYNFKLRQARDIPDIVSLIKINKMDVKDEGFRKLCLTYGTEEIYDKILENI